VKKLISIICLVALFLSTSSLAYFYWVQEHLHETKVFSQIKAGTFKEDDDCHTLVSLEVKDKNILPEGYEWEEEGREYTYKGMLYDIVTIEPTKEGWLIKAASDEEEVMIVSNKAKTQFEGQGNHKTSNHGFKINIAKIVFDQNIISYAITTHQIKAPMIGVYLQNATDIYLGTKSPPPQFV
jgi:hypothetical protein